MSIIAEVLNTANEAEMLSLPKKMSEISQAVSHLRTGVKELMEVKYLRLLQGNDNTNLVEKGNEVAENIKDLQTRLFQQTHTEASTVAEELRSMTESLIEARIMCDICKKLVAIDDEFRKALHDQEHQRYFSAAQHISNIEEMLSRDDTELEFLTIFEALRNQSSGNYNRFSSEALKIWKTEVSWINCQLDSGRKTFSLQVSKPKDLLENLIKTLNLYGVCEPQIYYFSTSLNTDVLIPCIEGCVTITIKHNTVNSVLSIVSVVDDTPPVSSVLENLTKVFEFLHELLDIDIDESRNFISELGLHLADKFVSQLVRESLSEAIPSRWQDLRNYEDLVRRISEFNALLRRIKFLPDGCDQLEKFCGNVEEQFLNKMIERYLSRAREISFMNLQDMTPYYTEPEEPGSYQTFDSGKSKKDTIVLFTELPNDFGKFPSCHISKSVRDLMALVKEILNDCVSGIYPMPNTALKLFCTARDCINLYVEITPVIHIKLLESLPQQSALFHNNCFYIAHELITLNEPYRTKYSDQVMRAMGTFVDMVSYVRAQGTKILEFQVSKQNDMLVDIVSRSGLSTLAEQDVPPMLEKSLRQCLHQLSFLETMWLTVLPSHVYNKIIGQLCNSLLEDIITKVCLTKDIKEATATHLVRLFGYVQESLPTLFEEPKEVHRHIKKWAKFTELIHILNGSLAEIGDRWADGKGPLALEFTAEQVRQLIKALFQVSDRRSAILSRIK
uniref:Centromere/kinetochore protein zw10 n=1 Tax=Lygus hesperus TaxID=30085 RepID=A0A0A9Z1P8_LYGHE